MTILINAILNDNDELAKQLINGSNLMVFAINLDHLVSNHARIVTTPNKLKQTPLHCAAKKGKAELVTLLITHEVDINAQDIYGMTALHYAILSGCARIVVELLQAKAKTDLYGSYCTNIPIPYTALQLSALLKHETIIGHLLSYRADPKAPIGCRDMPRSITALEIAILGGEKDQILILLRNGADINRKSLNTLVNNGPKYVTPLFLAFYTNRLDIVQILLEIGANPESYYIENAQQIQILTANQIAYATDIQQQQIAAKKRKLLELEKLDSRYQTTTIGKFIINNNLLDKLSEIPLPNAFICSITLTLMLDPVVTKCGETYDRIGISKWLQMGKNRDPVTNEVLETQELIFNRNLFRQIIEFLEALAQEQCNKPPIKRCTM